MIRASSPPGGADAQTEKSACLGAQPPAPDWGLMVSEGRVSTMTAWWISTFPGLAIFLAVLGFNLFGDLLRDVLDPRDAR